MPSGNRNQKHPTDFPIELPTFFIKPLSKPTDLIVDTQLKPNDQSLIAVKVKCSSKNLIKKLKIERNKKVLHTIDYSPDAVIPDLNCYSILGVIIQIQAKN